jgi:hypothetical protein
MQVANSIAARFMALSPGSFLAARGIRNDNRKIDPMFRSLRPVGFGLKVTISVG